MAKGNCIVPGCGRAVQGLGLCKRHWRDNKYGIDIGVQPLRRRAVKGSGYVDVNGYNVIARGHGKHQYEHIVLAEKALGRPLKPPEEVHHVNKIRSDNRPENLVICPDKAYHRLLHERQKALDACGNPNWRRCMICRVWDATENMFSYQTTSNFKHRKCDNDRRRLKLTSAAYKESLSKSALTGHDAAQAPGEFTILT